LRAYGCPEPNRDRACRTPESAWAQTQETLSHDHLPADDIVGFSWNLILSPLWGVAEAL
jgi:hypothetical protein